MKFFFILLPLFIAHSALSQTVTREQTFDCVPSLDLYLCIGQSNMAGRETLNETIKDTQDFNKMISSISTFIPHSAYPSSIGITPLKDESDPHFDAESQLILGKRYAKKNLEYYDETRNN